jgi:signal transduction histidine kinase
VLVGAGLDTSALVSLREDLPKSAFGDAVRWIALRMKLKTLLDDAEQSTGRIASLVEAVRSIARQERAEAADIDVHEQIRSALGILDHKLKNVRVAQNFSSESGHVRGYPSELAQVWVNLLDNAVDAVNGGGEIAIQTRRDDNQAIVEIIDNGPAYHRRIFRTSLSRSSPQRASVRERSRPYDKPGHCGRQAWWGDRGRIESG